MLTNVKYENKGLDVNAIPRLWLALPVTVERVDQAEIDRLAGRIKLCSLCSSGDDRVYHNIEGPVRHSPLLLRGRNGQTH